MRIDFTEIRRQVELVLGESSIKDAVTSIELEEEPDNHGDGFLRIIFHTADRAVIADEKLDALARSVQDRLIDIDERFPSVRFPDAA